LQQGVDTALMNLFGIMSYTTKQGKADNVVILVQWAAGINHRVWST